MLAKVSKISTAVMLGTMMLAGAAGNAPGAGHAKDAFGQGLRGCDDVHAPGGHGVLRHA